MRLAPGADISAKILNITQGFSAAFENALPSVYPLDLLVGIVGAVIIRLIVYVQREKREEIPQGRGVRLCPMECIILSVKELYMDAQEDMHMNDYNKSQPFTPVFP